MSENTEIEGQPAEVDEDSTNPSDVEYIPPTPERKVSNILHELEMLAVQKSSSGSLNTSNFTEGQNDKLLEILSKNEDNAFKFHTNRVNAAKDIELAKIDAGTINQRTIRYILLALIVVVPTLTVLILFYKEAFFIPWLTFLTGLFGGYGLAKVRNGIAKGKEKNPIIEEMSD